MNFITTKEMSKHLLAIGVAPTTADFVYIHAMFDQFDPTTTVSPLCNFADKKAVLKEYSNLPAWSLSALLALMPAHIKVSGKEYTLTMRKWFDPEYEQERHEFAYEYLIDETMLHYTDDADATTAAYKMVCWLFAQSWDVDFCILAGS